MSFSPGAILGLTNVSAAGAAQFTGAASVRGGRGAELQSKGKTWWQFISDLNQAIVIN